MRRLGRAESPALRRHMRRGLAGSVEVEVDFEAAPQGVGLRERAEVLQAGGGEVLGLEVEVVVVHVRDVDAHLAPPEVRDRDAPSTGSPSHCRKRGD